MFLDPVCKMVLTEEQVKQRYTFNEKTYMFCSDDCRDKFINDPKKYIGRNWWQRFLYRLTESNAQEFKGKKPSCH